MSPMKKKAVKGKKQAAAIPSAPTFGLRELAEVNRRAIADAGPRYFLNCAPNFPDLEIESFDEAIAGLVGGDDFRAPVEDIKQAIEKGWREFSLHAQQEYRGKLTEPQSVLRALGELAASAPGGGEEAIVKIRQRTNRALKKVDALQKRMDKAREKHFREHGRYPVNDPGRSIIAYNSALHRALGFMPEWDYSFITGKPVNMRANACGLHQNGTLVLHSEWGMGKTHSLCSLAKKRSGKGLPVLLVLAKDFAPTDSPGDALALHTGLAENFDGLLRRLNTLGRNAGARALLLVDGVNEKNPNGVWGRELGKIIRRVRRFPFVGLIVSYRTPFRNEMSESDWLKTPRMEHEGFREIPIEAQASFLKYYKVPLPEVPLMAEEFARPLMLKAICEAVSTLHKHGQRKGAVSAPPKHGKGKGFDGIASGQKGMTYIFECYIRSRAKSVIKKHEELKEGDVWALVKDKIAPYMAECMTEEMPAAFLLKSMCERFSVDEMKARKILRDMAKEGVISVVGELSSKEACSRAVIQMPYQHLGDHVIARYLLREHLRTESRDAVCRSFYANRPLGRFFALEKNGHGFRSVSDSGGFGVAETLILEFPERLKNKQDIPSGERELLFYLPRWKEKYGAYRDPFFRGLYWRAKAAFSKQTEALIYSYLCNWEDAVVDNPRDYYHNKRGVTDTLLSLACRHDSPIPARWLYDYVKRMEMADRDVLWGTATRGARSEGWTHNLFVWLSALEREGLQKISPDAARNYVVLLSLFLGATDRPLRDKATEMLVAIGEHFPAALFFHALDTLDFDDIYYPERMLAACYGVAMAWWCEPKMKEFHEEFPKFARAVAKDVFTPGGRLLTHHALVRDYALGIADVARKLGVALGRKTERHLSPPFSAVKSPFPPASEITQKQLSPVESVSSSFPDFHHRYTVPHIARNGKFKDISRQILRRVADLGFSDKKFAELDRGIFHRSGGEESRYGKVDRCGKKYSWIAYHEMCGLLDSQGKLSTWGGTRGVRGVLDPSFPTPPPEWDPKFRGPTMDGDDLPWMAKGPTPDYGHILELNNPDNAPGSWVMLEGFVVHRGESREVFSFLRGLLIRESDIAILRLFLEKHSYPGNHKIPHHAENHDVFGGEIPWSIKFSHPEAGTEEDRAFGAVPVGTTIVHNGSNEYHGERFRFSSAWYPAPDICAKLHLLRRGRGVDLVDRQGRTASLYRTDAGNLNPNPFAERRKDHFQFLHLRKDLLDEYLRISGKRLVWIVWGERRLFPKDLRPWSRPPEIQAAFDDYRHIHKRMIVYPQVKK